MQWSSESEDRDADINSVGSAADIKDRPDTALSSPRKQDRKEISMSLINSAQKTACGGRIS